MTPEIYNPGAKTWNDLDLTDGTAGIAPTYPFMFVLPDGKVFYAGGGSQTKTYTLDIQSEVWAEYPTNSNSVFGGQNGAAVMYEPGKVLKAGGESGGNLEQRTALIDLTDPEPIWVSLGAWNMPEERKDHNLVLLPDGKILLVGGTTIVDNEEVFVHDARMWDPLDLTPEWENMAHMVKERGHHSVAMLLPDATVLSAGGCSGCGNPNPRTAEIYKPGYLFTATGQPANQPDISSAPCSVDYGTQFVVSATPIADIDRVTLVRPGSVTHWFDSDQRFLELGFTVDAGDLLVNAPADPNRAPPGHYMMFVIDNIGVPSVARWIEFPKNQCPADLNNDDVVDAADLAILLGAWGPNPGHPADINCDGVVEAFDLALLLGAWGACPCPNCSQGSSHGGTELVDALVEMGYANVDEHTAWSTAAPTEDALASGQQLLELLGE